MCGFKHENAVTIVRCFEVPYQQEVVPFWDLWSKPPRIYNNPEVKAKS
jgi:hypothetical protein